MSGAQRTIAPIVAMTSIRGIAAWWVVFYHFRIEMYPLMGAALTRIYSYGYLAVDLFFELSGFVICLNYGARFGNFAWREYGRFMGLRLGRIYPLHITVLMLFLLNPLAIHYFAHAAADSARYDPVYFILSIFLLQNWGFTNGIAWNYPAWSISTELAAYLLFPVIMQVCGVAARRAWGIGALIAVLLGGIAVCADFVGGLNRAIQSFGLVRCILEFSIGAALASLYSSGLRFTPRQADVLTLAAVAVAAAFCLTDIPDYLLLPTGFFVLLCALTTPQGTLSRLLSLRAFELLGLISYSTYLVHVFAKDWVKFLLVKPGIPVVVYTLAYVVITLVASIILYRTIEVPGRSLFRNLLVRRA